MFRAVRTARRRAVRLPPSEGQAWRAVRACALHGCLSDAREPETSQSLSFLSPCLFFRSDNRSNLFFMTESMRLDGLWRLTDSPKCITAEGIPPVGRCLSQCSQERRKSKQRGPSLDLAKISLEDFPVLHAKAKALEEDRKNCLAS